MIEYKQLHVAVVLQNYERRFAMNERARGLSPTAPSSNYYTNSNRSSQGSLLRAFYGTDKL